MNAERTKNSARNIAFGVILKAYQILVPFLMRTALIYLMGVQYLGLSSLFTSILQVLNLAELGVGSAMVYSMYKPIAESDSKTICALLRLYKIYYRTIGIIIAIAGIIVAPFVPRLISGKVPDDVNVYILYLISLATTVLSYWLLAYKNSLLQAHQRADVISKVTIITNTVQYVVQIVVLWISPNYYIYLVVALLAQVLTNIVIAIVASKMYPSYQPMGKLDDEEIKQVNQRIKDLFTAKLGTVFSTSVDNVIISAYLGLTMLAVYQNYYYIMNSVVGVILVIFNSCTASIGNSLVVESSDKNYYDFRKLSFLIVWICIVCVSCFACVYQPFMKVWGGDELLLPDMMVIFMCIYFYVYVMQMLSCVYKDAAGIWHQDKYRPLIAGIFNLILNVSLVRIWGIYAIVLSTIISYTLIAMPWVIINLFSLVFKRSAKEYIIETIKGALLSGVIASICYLICSLIDIEGIWKVIINLIIAGIVSNILVIILRRKDSMYNSTLDLLDRITRKKFYKIIKLLKYKVNVQD